MINPRLEEFVKAMSLEGLAIPNNTPVQIGSINVTTDFSIEDLQDFYRLSGVQYRDGIYQIDIAKSLLQSRTQDGHTQDRRVALTNDGFYTPDYPLLHAPINALYQNREGSFKNKIEEARAFLENLINGRYLMTLSRVKYVPNGGDVVVHNYQQSDSYEIGVKPFIGPDGYVLKPETTNAEKPLQALLDTKQLVQEINEVYRWFRGKDSYIWRLNTEPKSVDERVARFDADSGRSGFVCVWDPGISVTSLGVRARKIKK